MQTSLFCSRCQGELGYDEKTKRARCGRCSPSRASSGKARIGGAAKIALTPAQQAIKDAHKPARRAPLRGGAGVLQVEMPSESVIQERIMRALHAAGWLVVRFNSGSAKTASGGFLRAYRIFRMVEAFASSGLPDVIAFKGGGGASCRALLIEVKDDKGLLRDSQVRFIEYAARFGVSVNVCRSWEAAQILVEELEARAAKKPTRARWERLLAIERLAREEWGEELDARLGFPKEEAATQ